MEILTEMSRLDLPHTVALMLKILANEQDVRVREQIILLLGYMRSTDAGMTHVCRALQEVFRKSSNERERLRILDVASKMPCPETVGLVAAIIPSLGSSVETIELQIAAADAVLRLAGQTPVDEMLVDDVILPLQQHALAAESRGLRKGNSPAGGPRPRSTFLPAGIARNGEVRAGSGNHQRSDCECQVGAVTQIVALTAATEFQAVKRRQAHDRSKQQPNARRFWNRGEHIAAIRQSRSLSGVLAGQSGGRQNL